MIRFIRQRLNPDWYHGHGVRGPFFEGWYFKVIDATETYRFAFIPGTFINPDPEKTHSFIQVLNGSTGTTKYLRYTDFQAAHDHFDVRIAENHFTRERINLQINQEETVIKGTLAFVEPKPWPITWAQPGIMGPFGWLPFMECNHGVVSLDHAIEGALEIEGQLIDFTGGRGYIEKDWGSNFPKGYIWMQCNHFQEVGTSLTASIAVIPNLGRTFPGFIVGLLHQGHLYRFTTYNRSQVRLLRVSDTDVEWHLTSSSHLLKLIANRAAGGLLKGPEKTDMHMRVDETMRASVEVQLYALDGFRQHLIYDGKGRNLAMEVTGDLGMLLKP